MKNKCLGGARVGASILEVYRAADQKGFEIHIDGAEITGWGEPRLHILDFDIEDAAVALERLAQTLKGLRAGPKKERASVSRG